MTSWKLNYIAFQSIFYFLCTPEFPKITCSWGRREKKQWLESKVRSWDPSLFHLPGSINSSISVTIDPIPPYFSTQLVTTAPQTGWSLLQDGKGLIILSPEGNVILLQEESRMPSCCVSWGYGTLGPLTNTSPCWLVMRRKLNLQVATGAEGSLVASISYKTWFFGA